MGRRRYWSERHALPDLRHYAGLVEVHSITSQYPHKGIHIARLTIRGRHYAIRMWGTDEADIMFNLLRRQHTTKKERNNGTHTRAQTQEGDA